MNHRPPSDDTSDSGRYLRDTAENFFFDLSSGIHKPKAYQHEIKRDEKTHVGPPTWQFWVTTVLSSLTLLAVAIYAYFAALQWCEMRATVQEVQQQTILQRQQLVGTQAAVLKVSLSFDIHGFSIGANNVRDVAATNLQVKVRMLPVALPKGTPESTAVIHEVTAMRVQKDNAFFRQWAIPWPQADFLEKGWPGSRGIRVEVEYSYEDGFGDRISDSVCMIRLPRFNIVTKRENAWGGGPVACEGIESTVQNILARMREAAKENKGEQQKQ